MRRAYQVLAYAISIEVVIQAMAIALGIAGLDHWIDGGAVVTKHVVDHHPSFNGSFGFPVHAINGEMLIPLLVIALLVVSFFTKQAGATRSAAILVGMVAIQVLLGVTAHDVPGLAPLHVLNAFGILAMAAVAARRMPVAPAVEPA